MLYDIFVGRNRAKAMLNGKRVAFRDGSGEGEIVEQLTAPTISLDGDILTMTATDSKTQEFVIFVDGVEAATVANVITFTLSVSSDSRTEGIKIFDTQALTVQNETTWREWVENTDYTYLGMKPSVGDNSIRIYGGDGYSLREGSSSSDRLITPDEVIQPNTTYYFVSKTP